MEGFVDRAAGFVEALGAARTRRGFLAALANFEGMVKVVPDYPGTFFTDSDYDALRALADRAIEHIERRLDARADRPSLQQELATTIYRLRAEMESIYAGLHHGAAGAPS